jgi:hypothetical protein
MDLFKIGSCELFAWAGLEPQSSLFLPPEQQGLQTCTTCTCLVLGIFKIGSQELFAQAGFELQSF